MTQNKELPMAKSVIDYIFRWLALKFLPPERHPNPGDLPSAKGDEKEVIAEGPEKSAQFGEQAFQTEADAPACYECGSIMVRNGSCHKCLNCGATSGCS